MPSHKAAAVGIDGTALDMGVTHLTCRNFRQWLDSHCTIHPPSGSDQHRSGGVVGLLNVRRSGREAQSAHFLVVSTDQCLESCSDCWMAAW